MRELNDMIEIPMPVTTPRLLLRPIVKDDAEAVLDLKKESWNEFLKWMIWVHPPSIETRTLEDEKEFCARMQERVERKEAIHCLAFSRADGRLVGHGSLGRCDWSIPMFTLGFAVRTGLTRRGYATEIGAALSAYAFDALKARKIVSFHADGNENSRRVIEKLGFEKEGILRRQHLLPGNRLVDEHYYGLFDKSRLPKLA